MPCIAFSGWHYTLRNVEITPVQIPCLEFGTLANDILRGRHLEGKIGILLIKWILLFGDNQCNKNEASFQQFVL